MPIVYKTRITLLVVLGCALVGCGESKVSPQAALTQAPAFTAKSETKPAVKTEVDQQPEPVKVDTEPATEQPAEVVFQPPYPHRENLFLAPKRSAKHENKRGIEQSVELLGFANVDGQRVILSINGDVVPMAEGAQTAGIEVISIQPPAVVLQRGRERWQATLEN